MHHEREITQGCLYANEIFAFFTAPSRWPDSVQYVLEQGIVLYKHHSGASLRLRGILLIILWVLYILAAQIFMLVSHLLLAGKPFIEKRKQWAKEIDLNFEYIENKTELINHLRSGDFDYILRLPVLQHVNVSHSSFKLFLMDEEYCLSVYNQEAKPPDKKGEVKFEQEMLFEYLIIDKQTGNMLLSKQMNSAPEEVSAKIVSEKTRRQEMLSILQNALVGGVLIFSIVQALRLGQIGSENFPVGVALKAM